MMQFTLSKTSLSILDQQLESKGDGFTIKQIRLLDKVINVFQPLYKDYSDEEKKLVNDAKAEFLASPENKVAIEQKVNISLQELANTNTTVMVNVSLEDEQFTFVKEIWDNSTGFRGADNIRKAVIEISDALEKAIKETQ